MMKLATVNLFSTLLAVLASCHTKPVKTVIDPSQKDNATGLKITKIYTLKKQTVQSDFNYPKLDNIDGLKMDTLNLRNLMPVFEPVNGQFRYYQFLSTFIDQAYNADGPPLFKEFHDILVLKTDNTNKIIDAYHYTLEWAEPPLQYDMFKSSARNVVLRNNLDISQLKFRRTYNWSDDNNEPEEIGIIKLE